MRTWLVRGIGERLVVAHLEIDGVSTAERRAKGVFHFRARAKPLEIPKPNHHTAGPFLAMMLCGRRDDTFRSITRYIFVCICILNYLRGCSNQLVI